MAVPLRMVRGQATPREPKSKRHREHGDCRWSVGGGPVTMVNVLVTEVAPPGTVATAFGALSALGGAAAISFNYIAGTLVDHFGYSTMFIICACLHPLGALILYRCYSRRATVPASS